MADPPRDRHTGEDARLAADRQPAPGMPRWVKVTAVIVAVLALLLVIVMLISGVATALSATSPTAPRAQQRAPASAQPSHYPAVTLGTTQRRRPVTDDHAARPA
jgi:cytochrome b561